jgi:ketosteroid isomerase-like protein
VHPHAALIERFYQAFQRHDAEAMVACYHPEITFTDPVFQTVHGDRAKAMWRMLVERSTGMELIYRDIEADETTGKAYWEAIYTFSQTGRKVTNRVHSVFQFQDGAILTQHDTFDLWRWAGMALGPQGALLGWTPFMQSAIRRQAASGLDAFIRKQHA